MSKIFRMRDSEKNTHTIVASSEGGRHIVQIDDEHRVSFNFAAEAISYIRRIVSINDWTPVPTYYIAYGSNLNVEQMQWRCPSAKVAGIATLHNWRLLFRGSKTGSYLTIEPYNGAEVPVAIWEITAEDEAALDRYEGFPTFYYKRWVPIEMADINTGESSEIEAMVYIMHEDRPLGIPSNGYVQICGRGYLDFGFDITVLEDAVSYVKEVVDNEEA